jgi:hypothetical protein
MSIDICANRHGGNAESNAAFRKLEGHIAAQTAEVLAVFVRYAAGLTAEQAEDVLQMHRSSVSARLAELKKSGLLQRKKIGISRNGVPIYERRTNRSGCTAAVLVLREEG